MEYSLLLETFQNGIDVVEGVVNFLTYFRPCFKKSDGEDIKPFQTLVVIEPECAIITC